MFKKIWNHIRNNHLAMMAVCCALPVFVILAFRMAGMDGWWLYPLALGVCLGSHVLMMMMSKKDGHAEGKSCH